jgi:hypothetical protein
LEFIYRTFIILSVLIPPVSLYYSPRAVSRHITLKEQGYMLTIALLICSNIFMTFAWYGHLKFRYLPLWEVILVSWLIAFAEYCFQVPANRWGYGQFTAVELKTIQEVISLSVFSFFGVLYLGEQMKWNYMLGFALLSAGAYFIFKK